MIKKAKRILADKNTQRGSMLVELLLSVALATTIIPFVFKYQQNAVQRAENIQITKNMEQIQIALERYIAANRDNMLSTVGKSITRVELQQLGEFGLAESIIDGGDEKYQLRVLKSNDVNGQATLQGVIVMSTQDITPLRTREIVSLSDGSMGFIDNNHAYGTFGAWHTDMVDLGLNMTEGIVETTSVSRDNALYLWRVPSDDAADATMMSALNLGGHDIKNAKFLDARALQFDDTLSSQTIAANDVIFQNRTTLDKTFYTKSATVSGMLSSDARNMEVIGGITLTDLGKFSAFTVENLWTTNLTLGGLATETEDDLALLNINQSLDMTSGRISALFVTVGFTGSITPRLVVSERIEDSTNPEYFWDVYGRQANLYDASFAELSARATLATYYEGDNTTSAGQIFSAVSANKNATVADYLNAIKQIENSVRMKYRQLNLQ